MITGHAYDCGPQEETGGPCIADPGFDLAPGFERPQCGLPREDHAYTEYDRAPGDMHEPPAYKGELDWPDVGQFTD